MHRPFANVSDALGTNDFGTLSRNVETFADERKRRRPLRFAVQKKRARAHSPAMKVSELDPRIVLSSPSVQSTLLVGFPQ